MMAVQQVALDLFDGNILENKSSQTGPLSEIQTKQSRAE